MKLTKNLMLASLLTFGAIGSAQASFVFSDLSYTSNSLTFTIDGDMSGYTAHESYSNFFSIQYKGDILNKDKVPVGDYNYNYNSGTIKLFDNIESSDAIFSYIGKLFGKVLNNTQIVFGDLSNAKADNKTVTLTLDEDLFNEAAINPIISFAWGRGFQEFHPENTTVLETVSLADVSPVPVPAAVWLFGSGILGMAGIRARKKKAVTAAA